MWAQPLLVVLVFMQQIDIARLQFNVRLILVVVPLALLALGHVLRRLDEDSAGTASVLRLLCLGAAALVLSQVVGYRNPDLDIAEPLADYRLGLVTTPQRYYQNAAGALPTLRAAFEPLDYLTRRGSGWDVYMAADWRVFVTAPLFGSDLQNRVWNFQPQPKGLPDALVFHSGPDSDPENLFYVGGRISPRQVRLDGGYELISLSPPAELWVRREALSDPAVRARLLEFYERRFSRDIAALRPVIAGLPRADVLVTSSPLGHGLRYLELTGAYPTAVLLSPPGTEREQVRRLGATRVITLELPLAGASSRELTRVQSTAGPVAVIFNDLGNR